MATKQNPPNNLPPVQFQQSRDQSRFEDRRLNASFVEMAGALASRPEPRQSWDNVAAGRTAYKGKDAVLHAKAAMRDAIVTADMATIEETAERIARHFREMERAALAEYLALANGEACLKTRAMVASKEVSEALHAVHVASHDDASIGAAILEAEEGIQSLAQFRDVAIVARDRRAQMRVVR